MLNRKGLAKHHLCNTRCVPYRETSYIDFDPVGIIYAWVLITESRTVLAETMSG